MSTLKIIPSLKATQSPVPFVDLGAQYASIREEIQEAVMAVLDSCHFVGGEYVEKFEEQFSRFVGAKFAVGVSSGTSALELALKASGIGTGDDVIVPANSFFATAEAVSNVGARPVFADVDPITFHLSMKSVQQVLTAKTRAVIPVHLYGRAMDLTELEKFASQNGVTIIEDAAQAHGAGVNGVKVGGSGRLTCFSFYPGKNLGAYGDAGAVTGSDSQLIENIRLLRDHGSPAKYQHSIVGTNARLDSMQAAVLSVKLNYLPEWNRRRHQHAETYMRAFTGSQVTPPALATAAEHVFHLFVIRTAQREQLQRHLAQDGIATGIHYPTPLHLTEAYQKLGAPARGSLPVAEALSQQILSLPMFAEMTPEQIHRVTDSVLQFSSMTQRSPSEALAA
jgi:dTDP-4-amino-4,6-dideoxygalactose transaminase